VRKPSAGYVSIAVCNQVMTSGFHSAEFQVTEDGTFTIGVIESSMHNWPKKKMRKSDLSSWCTALKAKHGSNKRITQLGVFISGRKGDIIRMELDVNEGVVTIRQNNELRHHHPTEVKMDNHCWAVFEEGNFGIKVK